MYLTYIIWTKLIVLHVPHSSTNWKYWLHMMTKSLDSLRNNPARHRMPFATCLLLWLGVELGSKQGCHLSVAVPWDMIDMMQTYYTMAWVTAWDRVAGPTFTINAFRQNVHPNPTYMYIILYSLKSGKPYQSEHETTTRQVNSTMSPNHTNPMSRFPGDGCYGTIPNWKFIALETTNGMGCKNGM